MCMQYVYLWWRNAGAHEGKAIKNKIFERINLHLTTYRINHTLLMSTAFLSLSSLHTHTNNGQNSPHPPLRISVPSAPTYIIWILCWFAVFSFRSDVIPEFILIFKLSKNSTSNKVGVGYKAQPMAMHGILWWRRWCFQQQPEVWCIKISTVSKWSSFSTENTGSEIHMEDEEGWMRRRDADRRRGTRRGDGKDKQTYMIQPNKHISTKSTYVCNTIEANV